MEKRVSFIRRLSSKFSISKKEELEKQEELVVVPPSLPISAAQEYHPYVTNGHILNGKACALAILVNEIKPKV